MHKFYLSFNINYIFESYPVVVSLGTGMIPVSELKSVDVFRPDGLMDAMKLVSGISAIGMNVFYCLSVPMRFNVVFF